MFLLIAGCLALTAFFSFAWADTAANRNGIIHHGIRVDALVTSVVYQQCGASLCTTPDLHVTYQAIGRTVRSTVSPNDSGNWKPGETVPVIYDRLNVGDAFYGGPGGDAYGLGTVAIYAALSVVVGLTCLAIVLFLTDRWWALRSAGSGFTAGKSAAPQIPVTFEGRNVRADAASYGQALTWKLLDHQPVPHGTREVGTSGRLAPGNLVVLRDGGNLIWPASRANLQPSIGRPAELRRLKLAHAQLLAAYTAALVRVGNRRPMVRLHIGARLQQLADAYIRAKMAVVSDAADDLAVKQWLVQARDDCVALAGTISGRWNASARALGRIAAGIVNVAAGFIGVVGIVRLAKHVSAALLPWLGIGIMLLAWVLVNVFGEAFKEKRNILAGPTAVSQVSSEGAERSGAQNCYKLEGELFTLLGQPKPIEPQSDKRAKDLFGLAIVASATAALILDGVTTGSFGEWMFDVSLLFVIVVITWLRRRRRREQILSRKWS